tara:strand:- start:28988 stop:29686 length:699 start_codon:yes stop_codon:yes gene_type:complete
MTLAALAILTLPAGCDLPAQTAPAAEAESIQSNGEDTSLLAKALVAPSQDQESTEPWLGLLHSMTDSATGTIRLDAPEALARELGSLAANMQAEAGIHDADWRFSFAIDGAQALSNNGVYDFDRIDEIARPSTPEWCGRDAPYVAVDAAGIRRIWQECSGTAPGENAETSTVRKFWIEETMSGDYRWLELTATGSTAVPGEQAALSAFSREALASIARRITLFPAHPDGGND